MKTKFILYCYGVSLLVLCTQAQPATLVQTPRLLKQPTTLTRAKMVSDLTTATLQDTNRNQFEFTLSVANDHLSVRSSVTNNESAFLPARFDGWTLEDLATVLENTIKRQFVWDGEEKALRPKNQSDLADSDQASRMFTGNAAKRLLRWAEHRLNRKATYMQ